MNTQPTPPVIPRTTFVGVETKFQLDPDPIEVRGTIPAGLTVTDGFLVGTPRSAGISDIQVTSKTGVFIFRIFVLLKVELNPAVNTPEELTKEFINSILKKEGWSDAPASVTRTVAEMFSAMTSYTSARMNRAYEDAFVNTARSAVAIRAGAIASGSRVSRKQSAKILVELEMDLKDSEETTTIPPMTQFYAGSLMLYNKQPITLKHNDIKIVSLYEGKVTVMQQPGLSTPFQTYITYEGGFSVEDSSVEIFLGDKQLKRVTNALWANEHAFEDSTAPNGRAHFIFGRKVNPTEKDVVLIKYIITKGAELNGQKITSVVRTNACSCTGKILTPLEGGVNEFPTSYYKTNLKPSTSRVAPAVSKAQLRSLSLGYAGVKNAVVIAQHELDGKDSNVLYVSAIAAYPWSDTDKARYLDYIKSNAFYGPTFKWLEPKVTKIDIEISVFTKGYVDRGDVGQAVSSLFTEEFGSNIYYSDVIEAVKSIKNVDYVEVDGNFPADVGLTECLNLNKLIIHLDQSRRKQ